MKHFISLVILAGFACSTLGWMNEDQMIDKWSKFKAIESCYGEDVTKGYMLKMKKAIAKCSNIDMPELDLPMFSSPYRAVQALLNGARDMEKKNVMNFQEVMKAIKANTDSSNMGGSSQLNYVPVPYPYPGAHHHHDGGDMMEQMMKKFFMKKMMQKLDMDMDDDPTDSFGSDDDEKFAEMLFFNKNKNRRTRREESDLYELGDRLSEKLMEQKEAMMAKLGNWSCVMQECGMVDKNLELDLESMLKEVNEVNIADPWLKEKTVDMIRTCYAYAQSLPQRFMDEMPFPEQWVKIKFFKKCKMTCKYHTCMKFDIKKKLEENFGPLTKLVETTGLEENQLLPMAMKLLHGDMEDMMM